MYLCTVSVADLPATHPIGPVLRTRKTNGRIYQGCAAVHLVVHEWQSKVKVLTAWTTPAWIFDLTSPVLIEQQTPNKVASLRE